MKTGFLHIAKQTKTVTFLLLFAFPLWPIKLTNTIFILYALLVLFFFVWGREKIHWKKLLPFLALSLLFVPYLLELLMFREDSHIQFETGKKLLFLFAPFIFYLDSRTETSDPSKFAIPVFVSAISLLSFVSFFFLLMNGNLFSQKQTAEYAFQLRTNFEAISGLHPAYYGCFNTLSTLWILVSLREYGGFKRKALIVLIVFLVTINLLLASKMALIILIIGSLRILFHQVKNKFRIVFTLLSILILGCLSFYFVPSLNSRFSEFSTESEKDPSNTLVERAVIMDCNRTLLKENYLTGLGSRNTQSALDACYLQQGFDKGNTIHLNSHNQFITFALNYGIVFSALFLGIILLLYLKSRRSFLAGLFWLCAILVMLTESFLERQMGIYLFLFFALLFLRIEEKESLYKTEI